MQKSIKERAKDIFDFAFKSGFVHSCIIPFLHAALWAAGLYCTTMAKHIFSYYTTDLGKIETIKSLTIFVVLFCEVMIVLLDIYVVQKANYLAPRFVLFVIALLGLIVGTAISGGCAFMSNQNPVEPLLWVLGFSSSLKLIENLLINNSRWYIIKVPSIFDARGVYTNRVLE